jgi:hypothetical protein
VRPPSTIRGYTNHNEAIQRLGSVSVPVGRLLAFPAVLRRSHAEPPQLEDSTRPGRLQMLVVHLVDPHYRICSTRNVPPQQGEWWASAAGLDQALGQLRNGHGLPREIVNQIWTELEGAGPMRIDEAAEAKRMRAEDERVYREARQHGVDSYSFLG